MIETSVKKNEIYVYITRKWDGGDIACQALAEDGTPLANHLSGSQYYAYHDMGFSSYRKHDIYNNHYPDGFTLVWLDDPMSHEGFKRAVKRNHEKYGKPEVKLNE